MRGATSTTVELTHDEYRTAWHALRLGPRHWNLDLPGLPEMTEEQRQVRASRTIDGLRARGLADHRTLAPAVADPLRVLAEPALELHGWVQPGQGMIRLLAASRGETGILALLDTNRLTLHSGPAGGMCAAVARLLPDRRPGPGTSISVRTELLNRPAENGQTGLTASQLETRLIQGGTRPSDARGFAAMLRGEKPSGAKVGAARRGQDGRRRTAPGVLVYLATERGGYTLQPSRGPDGAEWTTIAPATIDQVGQRIAQLLDTAARG